MQYILFFVSGICNDSLRTVQLSSLPLDHIAYPRTETCTFLIPENGINIFHNLISRILEPELDLSEI
jgi:hypothetical protein